MARLLLLPPLLLGLPRPQEEPAGSKPEEIAATELRRGHRVELKGRVENGRIEVSDLVLTRPDPETEWTIEIDAFDPETRRGTAFGAEFEVRTDARLRSQEGEEVTLQAISAGSWWTLKGKLRDDDSLRVESARGTTPRNRVKIVAKIQKPRVLEDGSVEFHVGGFEARVAAEIDVEVSPGIALEEIPMLGVEVPSLMKRKDEDVLPGSIRIGERIAIGGRLELSPEYRENLDLRTDLRDREHLDEERLVLEATAILLPDLFLLYQGRAQTRGREQDGNPDRTRENDLKTNEAYLFARDLLGSGFDLQVGRQDFDEPREWVYDQNLDAVRLYRSFGPVRLEGSVSAFLSDAPNTREDDVWNAILWADWDVESDHRISAYVVDRHDDARIEKGKLVEKSPFFAGARWTGEAVENLNHWLDVALVSGVEDEEELMGFGLDAGGTWVADLPFEPSLTVGYAFGTGDDDPNDRRSHAFRQSGMQDNNSKWNGVSSFRYYGEVADPELSNLHLATGGVGFYPFRRTSIDVVGHVYTQVEKVSSMRDWSLDAKPNGKDPLLGSEVDLVFGFREIKNVELKIAGGVFFPGPGLDEEDPAYRLRLVLRYRF